MTETSCAARKQPTTEDMRLAMFWWGIALGIVIGCALNFISGYDWMTFYYSQAHIFAPERLLNPLWIYFVLTPIAYLPVPWWAYLLSSAPLVLGPNGYWITTFVPLGCLEWIAARRLPTFVNERVLG